MCYEGQERAVISFVPNDQVGEQHSAAVIQPRRSDSIDMVE